MNEAYEIELSNIEASFITNPFELVLGVEKLAVTKLEVTDSQDGASEYEFQVIYARALVEDRWYFLPENMWDEIDEKYSDLIGEKLWLLGLRIE